MKTSKAGIDLLKLFEGLRLKAYKDVAGVWTIGYGHTATAEPDMKITEEQAERLLERDLEEFEEGVTKALKVSVRQNQFDALVCFAYNVGLSALRRSSALSKLNAGDDYGAADALLLWNKARVGGVLQEVRGLTRRRKAERELFLR